jgi:hypothetical protein
VATILELVVEHSVAVAVGGAGALLSAGFLWVRRKLPAAEDKRLRGVLRAFRERPRRIASCHRLDAGLSEPLLERGGRWVRASLVVGDELVSSLRPKDRSRHFRSWTQIRRAFIEALAGWGLEMPWIPIVRADAGAVSPAGRRRALLSCATPGSWSRSTHPLRPCRVLRPPRPPPLRSASSRRSSHALQRLDRCPPPSTSHQRSPSLSGPTLFSLTVLSAFEPPTRTP